MPPPTSESLIAAARVTDTQIVAALRTINPQ